MHGFHAIRQCYFGVLLSEMVIGGRRFKHYECYEVMRVTGGIVSYWRLFFFFFHFLYAVGGSLSTVYSSLIDVVDRGKKIQAHYKCYDRFFLCDGCHMIHKICHSWHPQIFIFIEPFIRSAPVIITSPAAPCRPQHRRFQLRLNH